MRKLMTLLALSIGILSASNAATVQIAPPSCGDFCPAIAPPSCGDFCPAIAPPSCGDFCPAVE